MDLLYLDLIRDGKGRRRRGRKAGKEGKMILKFSLRVLIKGFFFLVWGWEKVEEF